MSEIEMFRRHKPSTQSADRSRLHKHLLPELGHLPMKEITRDVVQGFIARKAKSLSSKSVKNCIALLGEMWQAAKVSGYTAIDPFVALRLPEPALLNEPSFSLNEMKAIINAAAEP